MATRIDRLRPPLPGRMTPADSLAVSHNLPRKVSRRDGPRSRRPADVTALLRDFHYGPAFDRKYGNGMAAKILGGRATVANDLAGRQV